jgi:hypothetical protein
MSIALVLYEQPNEAGEDKTRAKLITDACDRLEERYPQQIKVAIQSQVRKTELRLQKEIESVRLDIGEAEGRLRKETEPVGLKITEAEGSPRKGAESFRLQVGETGDRLVNAKHRQAPWRIAAIGLSIGVG